MQRRGEGQVGARETGPAADHQAVANRRGRPINDRKLLNIMTRNAQSLNYKLNELKLLINERKPDIVSITESWGNDDISDGIFALQGYTMYRDDKKSGIGGGTLLYVNNKIEQRICKAFDALAFESSTWCWIVIKRGKKNLIGSIYRSTSSSGQNDDLLKQVIRKADEIAKGNRLLILGDFNLPNINWTNDDLQPNCRAIESDLFDIFTDSFWQRT